LSSAQPLRVGVAGLGFGSTEYLPILEKMPEIKVVAGVDLRPQAREAWEKRYGGRTYDNLEALCADPDVEAVWISTPNQFHGQNAITAAEHGKHMCVRKPLALTMDECQRVVDAADKAGVKVLAGGQTQGTNPLVQAIRQMIVQDELGPLRAINMWAYTGWMLRPRMPQEVDEDLGGGVVWRQAPHQIETVRWLGGGKVRSVRAVTGRWRPERPNATGYFTAFLEFDDGTPVTMVYNAYGYFDSVELVSWGQDRAMDEKVGLRRALLAGTLAEEKEKETTRFGALVEGKDGPQIPWEGGSGGGGRGSWMPGNQGVFIVSLERGDVRMSPEGLYVYDDAGVREVPLSRGSGTGMMPFLASEPLELYNAVRHGKPMLHDARWGMATAEVQWAILESGRQRKEIMLEHQVGVPTGF
jgi:phthalate 4,5-cis-dihydrodiol dehydrogenase